MGDMMKINFDSFSNFWILVDDDHRIIDRSNYFENLSGAELLTDMISFERHKVDVNEPVVEQLLNRILQFSLNKTDLLFRGTTHSIESYCLIIAWPQLEELSNIKESGLVSEMNHPACLASDFLIMKDVINKSMDKVKTLNS